MKGIVLIILFSLWSPKAIAAKLEFIGRCDLGSPELSIEIEGDPRELISCHQDAKGIVFRFKQKVQLKIGSQVYPAQDEWPGYGESCVGALKSFHDFPEFQLIDPVSDVSIRANLDKDYQILSVTFGLRRDACRGLRLKSR